MKPSRHQYEVKLIACAQIKDCRLLKEGTLESRSSTCRWNYMLISLVADKNNLTWIEYLWNCLKNAIMKPPCKSHVLPWLFLDGQFVRWSSRGHVRFHRNCIECQKDCVSYWWLICGEKFVPWTPCCFHFWGRDFWTEMFVKKIFFFEIWSIKK